MRPVERVSKPEALVLLDSVSCKLFSMLKQRFCVGCVHPLSLDSIDCVDPMIFDDPVECAAGIMRRLQLLHVIADPDHETSSEVAVGLCVELIRELGQLQSLAPDIALDIEAALAPLEGALIEVTDVLAGRRATEENCIVVFSGKRPR